MLGFEEEGEWRRWELELKQGLRQGRPGARAEGWGKEGRTREQADSLPIHLVASLEGVGKVIKVIVKSSLG